MSQPTSHEPRTKIYARIGENVRLIPVKDILYFAAEDKYTSITYKQEQEIKQILIADPIKNLEQEFTGVFFRVHRNALIDPARVTKLSKNIRGGLQLHLRGTKEPIQVSRRHESAVRKLFKESKA